jgi:protein gp37
MSKIEWTGETWNPIVGCSIVSPGCTNCYAMRTAARIERMSPMLAHYKGLTQPSKAGPVWTGKVALAEDALLKPLKRRTPTTYFVNSMSDLFHEDVPDAWILRVLDVIRIASHDGGSNVGAIGRGEGEHTFQCLTKRSARMRSVMSRIRWDGERLHLLAKDDGRARVLLKNLWLGVSAEDQRRADERIPDLLATPAAVRFVSAEPLLGPIDFTRSGRDDTGNIATALEPHEVAGLVGNCIGEIPALDWIIVGGESGPGARPMHPDWARSIRDQCQSAGVAFFFKQWGAWEPALDRERDDPDWRRDYTNNYVDSGKSQWLNLDGDRGFHGERFHVMRNVGKARAGRLLDGRTWDEMPGRADSYVGDLVL